MADFSINDSVRNVETQKMGRIIHVYERRRGQQFYRVVSNVFIQGGDPNNDGTGDPGYYIKGEFSDCMIWYESNFSQPDDDIDWTFWEYTSRAKLQCFENTGRHLYMSVYRYGEDEFKKLILK